ncbi:MAG: hypothetical protein CNLJKLNK_01261 [Holosporales bacterium]
MKILLLSLFVFVGLAGSKAYCDCSTKNKTECQTDTSCLWAGNSVYNDKTGMIRTEYGCYNK